MFRLSRLVPLTRVATHTRIRVRVPCLLDPKASSFSFPYHPIRCLTNTSTAASTSATETSNQTSNQSSTQTPTSTFTSNGESSSQQSTPSWKYSLAKTVAAVGTCMVMHMDGQCPSTRRWNI